MSGAPPAATGRRCFYHATRPASTQEALFRAAIQLKPNNPDAHRTLALALHEQGR